MTTFIIIVLGVLGIVSYLSIYDRSSPGFEKRMRLRDENQKITNSIQKHQNKIEELNDSIAMLNSTLKAFGNQVPKIKESITAIEQKKQQAIRDNDFSGYVSQDSIYMDSISGLISLYDSTISIHEQKDIYQDSIIEKYIATDHLKEQFYKNELAYLKSQHQDKIASLNKKLKRVKRQRNLSLLGNAILTAIIFWKK